MKNLRIAVVAAVLGATLFVGAAPASATCHPEKPSTCEADLPDINDQCSLSPRPDLPVVLGVCDI